MRDYAELVKGLRDCSRRNARVCMICGAKASNLCEGTKSKRMFYAADAIEELLDAVPHWISVEERLPKKDKTVIVYYSWIGQSGTEYKEVSLATLEEMRYCGSKLLGWMPLPAPPKEVE